MSKLRASIAWWSTMNEPFFKAAERSTILGALKVAAFDLEATRGNILIVLTFALGTFLLAAWFGNAAWNLASVAWSTPLHAPPPPSIGPRAAAAVKLVLVGLVLLVVMGVCAGSTVAIINAIAAAAGS